MRPLLVGVPHSGLDGFTCVPSEFNDDIFISFRMAESIMDYLHFVLPKWNQAHFFSSQPLSGFEVVCVDPNKKHDQIWMISSLTPSFCDDDAGFTRHLLHH